MGGILYGTGEVIDQFFGVQRYGTTAPHYKHKDSCSHLSEHPPTGLDAKALLQDMYAKIERNWGVSRATYGKPPSKENWRLERRPDTARSNPSEEVTLERAIIRLSNRDWANQVPTASGLVGPTSDKRRCLDLVHRLDDRAWEFIELKIGSDTPLYAAMEILTYGLLYLFSRHHRDEFQYDDSKELLQASLIHLKVLAPSKYYSPNGTGTHYHLKWLEDLLNDGLRRFLDESPRLSLQMPFQFEAFPPDFEWTATTDATRDESVRAALRERRAIYA